MELYTCHNLLIQELTERRSRNSAYSMRAFARDLGIGSTTLSDFLAQKRDFSKSNLEKVVSALGLSPQQRNYIIQTRRKVAFSDDAASRVIFEEDLFRLIADWHYLAILSLARLKKSSPQPAWVARRLGISTEAATTALERLDRLGLVSRKGNRLTRTSKPLSTSREVPSAAIRKHHTDNLLLAEKALHNVPIDRREFSSVTMAVNPAKLPEAKELLMKTKRKISSLLEDGDVSEVYALSFQLFPLTNPEKEENT